MTDREKSITKKTLSDHAYTSIKNAIITAQREPNERLIEETIAADMGTSRTPVREALQKLEKEGLIFRRPQTGFVVKGIAEEEVEDILDLQCLLEGHAGRLAALRITEDELRSLDASSVVKKTVQTPRRSYASTANSMTHFIGPRRTPGSTTLCRASGTPSTATVSSSFALRPGFTSP